MTTGSRVIDIKQGTAMVVTDLHGDWEAYCLYRDAFRRLYDQKEVDCLVLCGDFVHHEFRERDCSLDIVLDLIQFQKSYGPQRVIVLLGNHELPHIYGMPLIRESKDCTPHLESAMVKAGEKRMQEILAFFHTLPFYIRTASGVMICHAGAHVDSADARHYEWIRDFSHQEVIEHVQSVLKKNGPEKMVEAYERSLMIDYGSLARRYFSAFDRSDPRYYYLLRSSLFPKHKKFSVLWNALFSPNEKQMGESVYRAVLAKFLETWSQEAPAPQRVLVTGHISVKEGYSIVAGSQLRLASYSHSVPMSSGKCLLFDCALKITSPDRLVEGLRSILV